MLPSRRFSLFVVAMLAASAPTGLAAQDAESRSAVAAAPTDVESLDAIIAALYEVISGPAGEARDWDRFRSLFAEGARLIPTGGGQNGPPRAIIFSPDDYIERVGPALEERGFFEDEIGRVVETFGMVTHAFSAYSSRWTPEDPEPFQRGINSIQLLNDGDRWWIVSIFWDSEREDNPIADRYLNRTSG